MSNIFSTVLTIAETYGPEVWAALQAVWAAFQEYTSLMAKAKAGSGDVTPADVGVATQEMNTAVAAFFAAVSAHAETSVPGSTVATTVAVAAAPPVSNTAS